MSKPQLFRCPWCGHLQHEHMELPHEEFWTVMCERCDLGYVVPIPPAEPPE